MTRSTMLLFWGLLVLTAGFLLALEGCGGSGGSSPLPSSGKIQHVVVIFQENRTPDNLFHGLPNADIASSGLNSSGQTIPLAPVSLVTDYDLGHTHEAFVNMYDGGKMDGADRVIVGCKPGATNCPPPNPQFAYVNPSEVAPYFQMAQQYTFADRMFQTNQGPSFPAHQFIISGTSAPTATSNLFASENPLAPGGNGTGGGTGCTAAPDQFVQLIDPSGNESQTQYPCFEHPTLVDLLDAKKLTWRYYTPSPTSIWTGPNAIRHICVPDATATECTGPDWTNVILRQTQVLTDIANGSLAAVSWVIPTGKASDHASGNDGSGPSWVASVVNAIGTSQYWSNTAIFITWDDWGGWYDHVAPTIINSYEYGFRVPLIVVSPYAKSGYVSHVTHDFGSILKFIEQNFGLPSLGYADAPADNLSDCFDFSQTPLTFQTIPAALDANFFLNDKRSPTDPDDD
ncbi:MAG TPA: alkaline phosphatase family protein [Terriglobales bacterium]|jgi:phospholipase C|nr:alkaline phosphatase family protein [Terriglobales bacterium]